MPTVFCTCGAKYTVPASALGRRARCKKCGQMFEVHAPEDAENVYSLTDLNGLEQGNAVPAPAPRSPDTAGPLTPVSSIADTPWENAREWPAGSLMGFFAALSRVFLFPARPRNLLRFLIVWVILTAAPVACAFLVATGRIRMTVLALLVFVLSEGMFAAFSFNVVRLAAEGEDELPALPLTEEAEDWWNQLVVPFFSLIGTFLLALAPALVCFVAVSWGTSAGTLGPAGDLLLIGGLALLGLFLWPMFVLALVMGDVKALSRVGAMIATVVKTAIPYCCTVLLVYGAAAILLFAAVHFSKGVSSAWALLAVIVGIRVYAQVVAMRAIGVYYHRFSDRFDWL